MIVVIDHHAAHIYRNLGGSKPEGEVNVKPYDPFGFQHHLIHRKEAHYQGERVPEEDSYYAEIATDLVHAEAIILIGHGTGKSNAAEFLADYLKAHRPEEFQRIVAIETADLSALTEPQIEEIARGKLGPPPVPLAATAVKAKEHILHPHDEQLDSTCKIRSRR
jgi:hypothetical protein